MGYCDPVIKHVFLTPGSCLDIKDVTGEERAKCLSCTLVVLSILSLLVGLLTLSACFGNFPKGHFLHPLEDLNVGGGIAFILLGIGLRLFKCSFEKATLLKFKSAEVDLDTEGVDREAQATIYQLLQMKNGGELPENADPAVSELHKKIFFSSPCS